jgi:hypothetical protein
MQTEKWLRGAKYDEVAFRRLALKRRAARLKAPQCQ